MIDFDEVGSLMDETDNGRFIALNRIINRELPLNVSDETVQHAQHYACSTITKLISIFHSSLTRVLVHFNSNKHSTTSSLEKKL